MANPNIIYILLDFSCGRFYTHHSSYLRDYESYLNKFDLKCEVWINNSADEVLLNNMSSSTKPVLRSIMYSFDRHHNFLGFVRDKVISKFFLGLVKYRFPDTFIEFLKEIFAYSYYRSAIKRLNDVSGEFDEIVLIFPTFDALSFRLTKYITNKSRLPIKKICIRVTGAEKRGAFSVASSEDQLLNLALEKSGIINLGIEVNCYRELLVREDFESSRILWAPMPEVKRLVRENVSTVQDPGVIKIGFLGSARKTKGFEELPEIFSKLTANNVNFKAYIQLPNFFWNESESVISLLQNDYSNFVNFIPGGSPREMIDGFIAKMDLVVLPYSLDAYKNAGSGILYLAADLEIPIFAHEKLAFAWDIEKFAIGETYLDYDNLAFKLKNFNKSDYLHKLIRYNAERNSANNLFVFDFKHHPTDT